MSWGLGVGRGAESDRRSCFGWEKLERICCTPSFGCGAGEEGKELLQLFAEGYEVLGVN